jgi:BlaI family transcriptional regulator, penicillinase repressor
LTRGLTGAHSPRYLERRPYDDKTRYQAREVPVSEREAIFTERELDIMNVLWERGNGTVAEVKESIRDELAYTTVLTILRTLEAKGFIDHEEEGRAYRYFPVVEKEEARESHLNRLMTKLFAGSPEALLTQLVSDRKLPRKDLERMRRLIEDRLG